MSAPLEGVRVLDLTWGPPGAIATMMLADYGAEVVWVERPGGDPASRAGATRTWDRGKRRFELDLADSEDRRTVLTLAAEADVVLVGLAPETVHRYGLSAEALIGENPDLVYVSLTGFGMLDDRETPGLEPLVAAELGAMITSPGHRDGPVFLGHPAVSYSTALVAVIGTLAALRARIVAGHGDVVDVSMLDGVLAQFAMNWWSERNVSFVQARTKKGELVMGRTRMLLRTYRCADGELIQVHTGAAGAFGRLMKVLGLDDRISPAIGPVESACPLTDTDLATLETIPDIFRTKTSPRWLEELWSNEIAALPVQQPGEVFADEQVVHNGLIRQIDDAQLGPIDVVAPPIHLSRTPAVSTRNMPLGADSAQWQRAGLGAGGSERLDGGPLEGVRIVEFATFFASPYANRLLCDLGADVVKVESTSGDPIRSLPDPFEGASRGKRSIAVDLKSADARPIIEELLRAVDIVQHNFRPGVAERLRIDDASVRTLNPEVIYDYAPGYGASGPKSRLQSFAPLHSGFVGIWAESAGAGNEPMPTFGNEDYYNGQLNAIAMLLALVHKARTGEGQYVECAQLSSSVFVTSHWYRAPGELRSALPTLDSEQYGWGPYCRLYMCLEGWLCVCCVTDEQRTALRTTVIGSVDDAADVDEQLTYEFFGRTAIEWNRTLHAAGVPCAVARETSWLLEFLQDPRSVESGRATRFDHDEHGSVSAIARIVQLQQYGRRPDTRAPTLGEHTREIAASVGIDEDRVNELVAAGVLRTAD